MSLFSKIKGSIGGQSEPAPSPPTSSKKASDTSKASPTADKPSEVGSAMRVKEYSGLEIKTLWNHFSKDSLITGTELAALLERILAKDAADLLIDLKEGHTWKKYATRVLRAMDTSKGETLDLSEFSNEFNNINRRRFYYFLKYLLPDILAHLRKVSGQMLSEADLLSFDKLLEQREAPAPVVAQVRAENAEIVDDSLDKEEIARLERLVEELHAKLAEVEELLRTSKSDNRDLKKKVADMQNGSESVSSELDRIKSALEESRVELAKVSAERDRLRLKTESEDARHAESLAELQRALAGKEAECARMSSENEQLRAGTAKDVTSWAEKFEGVIAENGELRAALSTSKTDIDRLNFEVVRINHELAERLKEEGLEILKLTGASLTGIELDPLRTELVRRFGSIDAFVLTLGKDKKGITLTDLELLGLSMGYSREYCKKLFYTLDTHDKGIVSIQQFARPLPIINHELCLLTKGKTS